jgi:cell division protein FtsZ
LIVGLGNGGCRAVAAMAPAWAEGPALVGVNTETHADVPGMRYVTIGAPVMKGLGSGGDPRVGRRAAEADVEALRALCRDVDLMFLVVGLGGGTGTGAAPLLAAEASKAGVLTLCFAMLPFEFEGPRRMEHARRGLQALREAADGVICLPNQRLLTMVADRTNVAETFRAADQMLSCGVQALWRVLSSRGLINLDFADLRRLLQQSSAHCVFGCAEGVGPKKISAALQAIRKDPLLQQGEVLAQASKYIVSIIGGTDLTLQDVDQLMRGLKELGRPDALAMAGVSCEAAWQDKVFITILAAEPAPLSDMQGPAAARQPSGTSAAAAETARSSQAGKLTQPTLFDGLDKGRFKDVGPTIVEGSNLDIPTFIRRGIMIQKIRDSN